MPPAAITAEAKKAGLDVASLDIPSKAVAGKPIDTGDRARTFAGYMRIHALEASGGLTYAQMGRFVAKPGTPKNLTDGQGATSIDKWALLDPKTKQPVENGRRNVWVTETALSTALNTSYMAERISLFGIGFAILAVGGALRNPETALGFLPKRASRARGAVTA